MNHTETPNLEAAFRVITPQDAQAMLMHNINNRPLNVAKVKAYSLDMKAGNWDTNHQGIAFERTGRLADGQHRLHAIIDSGCTIKMLVTENLDPKSNRVIDSGDRRSAHDAFMMSGDAWMTKDVVSVTRVLLNKMGMAPSRWTNDQINEFATAHKKPISKALAMPYRRKKCMTPAIMFATYACAIAAGESEEKVARFANVLITGEIKGPHENACIRFREYIIENPNLWSNEPTAAARRAQRALSHFCNDQPLGRLRAADSFTYPIIGHESVVNA